MSHTANPQPIANPRCNTSYKKRSAAAVDQRPTTYKKTKPSTARERKIVVKSRTTTKVNARKQTKKQPKPDKTLRKLALLLPGHNEELIIGSTIKSAIAAGQSRRDIYVVDDNSDDDTRKIAISILGKRNVLSVSRSGKALATKKAIDHFKIASRYTWVHIADADSIFSQDYFNIFRSKLNDEKNVVALGFVQSLRGNWISTYRAVSYTYNQQVNRRIQEKLGMISVFPGSITAYRTSILKDVDLTAKTITEDFDVTLQVHRKKLGRIIFIPKAVNYTQDPLTVKDFWRQNMRWQRGFWQCSIKYRIGLRPQLIDLSLTYQVFQIVQLLVIWPAIVVLSHRWMSVPIAFSIDIIINSLITLGSSIVIKRWYLIGMLPYFYFLRWLEIASTVVSFYEVVIARKFKDEIRGWATEGRRYKVATVALQDVAV